MIDSMNYLTHSFLPRLMSSSKTPMFTTVPSALSVVDPPVICRGISQGHGAGELGTVCKSRVFVISDRVTSLSLELSHKCGFSFAVAALEYSARELASPLRCSRDGLKKHGTKETVASG